MNTIYTELVAPDGFWFQMADSDVFAKVVRVREQDAHRWHLVTDEYKEQWEEEHTPPPPPPPPVEGENDESL